MPIVNRIAEFEEELIEWPHQLHKFPELGFEEHQTAEFIAEKLNQMGLDVNRELAGTGVVATLTVGSGNGPKIGLRADMDALPILERSEFEHASKNPGVMHACGHDGHTTMLLGAAKYLAETKNFDGTVHRVEISGSVLFNLKESETGTEILADRADIHLSYSNAGSTAAVLNAKRVTNKQLTVLLANKVADRVSLAIAEKGS